jgi:hypothetical protein
MQPTMASPAAPPVPVPVPARADSGRRDAELGRELVLCHRRKPKLVWPVASLVLGGMTALLMLALALDSTSTTGSDYAFLAVLVGIFAGTGAILSWYRRRIIGLRQVIRICERGIVRDDIRGRRVLMRFADVTKIDHAAIVSPLMSMYMVTLRGTKRLRTVLSSQRYDNVDPSLTEMLRALAPAAGR